MARQGIHAAVLDAPCPCTVLKKEIGEIISPFLFQGHLIGFFIFLALTIYTATQFPNVVDIQSLQHLPDVLRKADIHKIQAELVSCLPSLPHLSDIQKLKDELKSSWNSMEVLPSLSRWHLLELLSNCLPHIFTHPNETNSSVLNPEPRLLTLNKYPRRLIHQQVWGLIFVDLLLSLILRPTIKVNT